MVPTEQLLPMLRSLVEEAINDPALKADLGIPPVMRFDVTVLDPGHFAPRSLPLKITAVGEGFSPAALYAAEDRLRARMTADIPRLPTWTIHDH